MGGPGAGDDEIDLDGVLRVLWRRRALILGVTLGALCLCATVLFQLQPRYTARVLLRLNDRENRVVAVPGVVADLTMEAPTVQSEVEVLRSRALAEAVVDAEALTENPAVNPVLAPPSVLARALNAVGLEPEDTATSARDRTVEAFRKALSVDAVNRSYVIAVAVSNPRPKTAAQLAEATARLYIARQVAAKEAATRAADQWLADRLRDTRLQVADAEAAVATYRASHALGQPADGTLATQQRAELNSQLVVARADRVAAEARLSRLRRAATDGGLDTAPEILASPLIQRLREQEAEVRRRVADLSSRYGERHPRMIDARAELAGLTAQIGAEAAKLAEGVAQDARTARTRENALDKALDRLEGRRVEEGQAVVGLHELEREAASLRALHQTFLNRYAETTHRLGLSEPDASVISHAAVPRKPSWPRKGLSLAATGVVALFLALTLAYAVERLDRRLRRPEEVEKRLGLPCLGQLPLAPKAAARTPHLWPPTGQVAEDMRSLRLSLSLSRPAAPPAVVCVTSSQPGEGKTTLCLWLGCEAAAGRRVLIVDADLRRPRLAALAGIPERPGLPEVLADEADLSAALRPGPVEGLRLLPGRVLGGGANDLLAGPRLPDLINRLREEFDLILMDTPPVLPVADARLIAPHADSVLYAVRWEATPWPLAAQGLDRLRQGAAPEPRVVLTQVNLRRQRSYGYGGYTRAYAGYGAYYGA